MTLDEMRKLPSKEVWKIAHDIQNADRECALCGGDWLLAFPTPPAVVGASTTATILRSAPVLYAVQAGGTFSRKEVLKALARIHSTTKLGAIK